jgi:hypothetical protein
MLCGVGWLLSEVSSSGPGLGRRGVRLVGEARADRQVELAVLGGDRLAAAPAS